MTQRPEKLLDQVRDAIGLKHYAYSTDKDALPLAQAPCPRSQQTASTEMGETRICDFAS